MDYAAYEEQRAQLMQAEENLRRELNKTDFDSTEDTEVRAKLTKVRERLVELEDQKQALATQDAELQAVADPLQIYLRRLLEECSQIVLSGIDRNAPGRENDTNLNLCEIYTALLTHSTERQKDSEHRLSAVVLLNRHQHLVLLGDPGCGKSTFINFTASCFAGEFLKNSRANLKRLMTPPPNDEDEHDEQPQSWEHGLLLPVRVILRDFAAKGLPSEGEAATGNDLWQFIAGTLQGTPFGSYVPTLQAQLKDFGGLVLLDGLDEVPEAHNRRSQIKQAVEDFVHCFPKCRILVTSRTYAYQKQEWRLSGFADAVLASFTQGQIARFVDRWYEHSAPLLGMRHTDALGRAERLKRVILNNRNLYELAERPLLLTLMASLHAWRGGSLPEKREELYNDAVELLLNWWESLKIKNEDGQGLSLTEALHLGREGMSGLRRLMEELAYKAHLEQADLVGTANISEERLAGGLLRLSKEHENIRPRKLVEHLQNRAGLLLSHGVGVYTFPHRTFQEYLAACHFTEDLNNYPDNIAKLARHKPNRWREVLLLAGAKAARGTPSSIWDLAEALCCRKCDEPEWTEEDAWGALLAGQVLVETVKLDVNALIPRYRRKIEPIRLGLMAILTEQLPLETQFPSLERALAGNILAILGDPRSGIGLREDGLPEIEWCEAPEGDFVMGSDKSVDKKAYPDEEPQHSVTLSTFHLSRYPVTNAQYQAFVTDGGYTEKWRKCWSEEGWKWKEEEEEEAVMGPEPYGDLFDIANHPVVGISWYEAQAYCCWLTEFLWNSGDLQETQEIRLPSEAEWEKAARGTDGRIFPWSNTDITPELANYSNTELGATSAVGCFSKNVSPYGCEEMSGNVFEWCADWFTDKYYAKSPAENPTGPASGSSRVIRGGAWYNVAGDCRAAYRCRVDPGNRYDHFGFRLLRTPL